MQQSNQIQALKHFFDGRWARVSELHDGQEDLQAFLDRAVVWVGAPVSAVEIEAKVAEFDVIRANEAASQAWKTAMAETDATMTRQSEDIIGTMSDAQKAKLPAYTADAYAAKVTLRGEKP